MHALRAVTMDKEGFNSGIVEIEGILYDIIEVEGIVVTIQLIREDGRGAYIA